MPQNRREDPDPGKAFSGVDEETTGRRDGSWLRLRNGTVSTV
jgi:hypothetical protein